MKLPNLPNIIIACAAGFLGGTLASRAPVQASSPEVVRASKFELLDASGRPVARWETDPKTKNVRLSFLEKGGSVGLDIGVSSDVLPFVRMNGRDGKNRIALELGPGDRPGLNMSDARWLGRISLGQAGTDTPDIPDRLDQWVLRFSPFGTTRPAAMIGITNQGGGETEGVLFVNGKQIR